MNLRLLPAAALLLSGCDWVALASNAISYETVAAGAAANVVATDSVAYVALGDSGVAVVDARIGARIDVVAPTNGLGSVDDLAISDGFLFLLDARPPGGVSVLSLRDARHPRPVGAARAVDVGPFSGVSAANGVVVVSGGTSALSVWRVDERGSIAGPVGLADFGRGQPDVLLTRTHRLLVSTHLRGPHFGVDVARFRNHAVDRQGRVPLRGAGFTTGGAKPANFPIEAAEVDDSTFVVAFGKGVAVVRVGADGAARLTRTLDVGGPAVNIDARDRVAAVGVAGARPAIVIMDFANEPRITSRIALPAGTNPSGVALTSHSVIVAARDGGVLTLRR